MVDMLVRLYDLPPLEPLLTQQRAAGVDIRRPLAAEKSLVINWIRQRFSPFWVNECEVAFAQVPISCLIAVEAEQRKLLGFTCYDAVYRNFFGPIGVDEAYRGRGIGKALLLKCLHEMVSQGYAYAIIPWVGPKKFYADLVGAIEIEGSEPGVYRTLLKAEEKGITMSSQISFISANFVARQLNYQMTEGWMQGDKATNDYFKPLDTYAERIEVILRDVKALGFAAIDIWLAHLNWSWATAEHIAIARDLLKRFDLVAPSLAGGLGQTRAEFVAACQLAQAMEVKILAGMTPVLSQDRAFVIDTLHQYGVKLAIENHPEKTPEEMLAKIGDDGGGRLGTAVDTGWYGTQGYDAAQAIEKLGEHIFIVHLKDVLEPGTHHTCRYGRGCVPIEACVSALKEMGYRGYYGVEHEPEDYDPTEDCKANLAMLREWLAA